MLNQISSYKFRYIAFDDTEFNNGLQEQLLVKIRNVIQTTSYNDPEIKKYFGYDVPYSSSILDALKKLGCRNTNKFSLDCDNSTTYIDILNTLNEIILKNITDVDFVHLIPVADYEFISEEKTKPISSKNFAFIYHIDIAEQYIKLGFLRIQDGHQVIDMRYRPDPTKFSFASYHMPFDQQFTIMIDADDITEFDPISNHNVRPRLLTNTFCHFKKSNKTYPVEIFYLSSLKVPQHLALRLLNKTIYVPISRVSFTFTNKQSGSGKRRTIHILGRERKIHKEGRKSYIIFQKQYMSLADARTLEKKRTNETKTKKNLPKS